MYNNTLKNPINITITRITDIYLITFSFISFTSNFIIKYL